MNRQHDILCHYDDVNRHFGQITRYFHQTIKLKPFRKRVMWNSNGSPWFGLSYFTVYIETGYTYIQPMPSLLLRFNQYFSNMFVFSIEHSDTVFQYQAIVPTFMRKTCLHNDWLPRCIIHTVPSTIHFMSIWVELCQEILNRPVKTE